MSLPSVQTVAVGQGKHRMNLAAVRSYLKDQLFSDVKAGFITAVVAFPLAVAFAIASGLEPIHGLYTAIIAGILGSSLGGSKFSITGPTGAMTVIILTVVQKHGLAGLLLAGLLAGCIQVLLGVARLGRVVSYIPIPVITGFTSGIGIIILLGQLPNALGISIGYHEFIGHTLLEIARSLPATNLVVLGVTLTTALLIWFVPSFTQRVPVLRNIPASLMPLVLLVLLMMFLHPSLPQIGVIPARAPDMALPSFDWELLQSILPMSLTIALLGAIEALLCAVVCDGMSGTKHDPNKELIAQGVANMALPFFGGMPATAAIARSAVNIREGAKTRLSGVYHALFLVLFLVVLSPIIALVPKAYLAGLLIVVSLRMISIREIKTIARISKSELLVLFVTLGLTVLYDLVFAVQVGMILAIFLLFVKLTRIMEITSMEDYKQTSWINRRIATNSKLQDQVGVFTIIGPFFFGAMSLFENKLDEHIHMTRRYVILRLNYVSFIDSTAIVRLNEFLEHRMKKGSEVILVGIKEGVRAKLYANEDFMRLLNRIHLFDSTNEALAHLEKSISSPSQGAFIP